jgi:predicted nuclease of restriction endonuclease-like RecB superfamily
MTNPLVNAFFLGRATAEVLAEELEHGLTDVMSNVGKFDAEQRERLRQFTQQVMERAEAEASSASQVHPNSVATSPTSGQQDLQEIIDELRAEIAQLRAALQDYRQKTGS